MFCGVATFLVTCPSIVAEDWPQTLGPDRNGTAGSYQLTPKWPAQFAPAWQVTLGSGYAGPAVVGSRVLVPHRLGNQEILSAFDLANGNQLWDTAWPASYRGTYNPDSGPRCVPTVSGDLALVYGAAGDLQCVRITDGELLWRRRLRQEYDADDGYFGAGSAPLVVNDLAIVCLGGEQAGVIAVELKTGKTRWTATDYDASYAAPILIDSNRRSQDSNAAAAGSILVVTRYNTLLMDAATGKVLSDVRFGARGPTVNAATPVLIGDDRVLLTASYGIGAAIFEFNGNNLIEETRNRRLLGSQYNTPVVVGDRLIGIDGREDGSASLRAIELESLEILWDEPGYGTAHLLALEDQVLSLTNAGRLDLIDATSDSFQRLAFGNLPSSTYRALPALVGNRLLIRANSNTSSSLLMLIELP